MSFLESYTWRVLQSKGLLRQRNLEILRMYLRTTPDEGLIFAIRRITKVEELKVMWEAGLKSPVREAVLDRVGELTGRRAI